MVCLKGLIAETVKHKSTHYQISLSKLTGLHASTGCSSQVIDSYVAVQFMVLYNKLC